MSKRVLAVLLSYVLAGAVLPTTAQAQDEEKAFEGPIKYVLLISIDGFHAVDFLNCSHGIAGFKSGQPYCPNLVKLAAHGVNYTDASTSKPSDSFPGLTAIVSGGSPRTFGAFYDVAYDRALDPPAKTTGNGLVGAPGLCTAGMPPTGTSTEYEEGIDIDQTQLNGIDNSKPIDGGVQSIDATRLPRDPAHNCAPVYPWNFVRTNTIFGVIHKAGGYTAWSDKHPAYASVSGPGPGMAANLDDFYGPEINSNVIPLKLTTVTGQDCTVIDSLQTGSWTDSFQNIRCYDSLKVNAILNEIKGRTHSGKSAARVPRIFGMNFQAVSVGQKLIEYNDTTKTIVATGGYQDAIGTPTEPLFDEIEFVDKAIGAFSEELQDQGIDQSTLVVITAKHGQSPIDPHRFFPIPGPGGANGMSPDSILCALLPASESPNCAATGITDANAQIGPTEDDVSLIWLKDSSPSNVANAVQMLETQSPPSNNIAGIGEIFWGPAIAQMFNPADSRTPDIIVTPNIGVIYTGSKRKLEEHGGFAHDDTNVITLVSNPTFRAKSITSPVETSQVAPTILKALGLDPHSLQAVQMEGTQVLPGLGFLEPGE